MTALHEIPDHVSAETAVAMIGTGRTAVGVLEVAALTAKVEQVRALGATVAVDYLLPDWPERVRAALLSLYSRSRFHPWAEARQVHVSRQGCRLPLVPPHSHWVWVPTPARSSPSRV